MSNNMTSPGLRFFSAAALLSGVVTVAVAGPTATEADFGNSVRNMIEQQTYDPKAAAQPAQNPPTMMDGERAAAALKVYRTQTEKPAKTDVPIGIVVGR